MAECIKCGKENWFSTREGNICRTEGCGHRLEDEEEHKGNVRT